MQVEGRIQKQVVTNRKARHEYSVVSVLEAGLVLQGTEIKSLRRGGGNLQDSHCKFLSKDSLELFVYGFNIAPYELGTYANHTPKRPKKLLLNYKELRKLKIAVLEKNILLIPLSVYLSGHLAKLELGLCHSKKKYDKREAKKENEVKRDIARKYKVR